jgi:hypothetical protein
VAVECSAVAEPVSNGGTRIASGLSCPQPSERPVAIGRCVWCGLALYENAPVAAAGPLAHVACAVMHGLRGVRIGAPDVRPVPKSARTADLRKRAVA